MIQEIKINGKKIKYQLEICKYKKYINVGSMICFLCPYNKGNVELNSVICCGK